MNLKVRAGFVGFGEVNTPREFIDPRCAAAAEELQKRGVELVITAPVSDDPAGENAARAVRELAAGDIDALVLCVAGWIPSWAVFKVVEQFKHLPIVLWGLSGWNDNGRWVTTADQAGTTALRAPLVEQGYKVEYIVNFRDDAPRYDEVADVLFAASARRRLTGKMLGMTGYRDMRLFGTLYDGNLLKSVLGLEIEHIDLLEIKEIIDTVPEEEIAGKAAHIRKNWKFVREPQEGTVEASVRLALAFRRKIGERGYAGFSFCDVDGVKKLMKFAPAGAMTLLHQLAEVPTVPENDSYGLATQAVVRELTGEVAGYLEFYEFGKNTALMGVPDYVPYNMVDGQVTVMPNAFGSFGEGLLNVSKLKTGTVTMVRFSSSNGKLFMHMALAEAKTPPAWEEAGWAPPAPQLPSLEMHFAFSSDRFLENVIAQHYIIAYGDIRRRLKYFCRQNGIDVIETV